VNASASELKGHRQLDGWRHAPHGAPRS
jgi:hypothetical protein